MPKSVLSSLHRTIQPAVSPENSKGLTPPLLKPCPDPEDFPQVPGKWGLKNPHPQALSLVVPPYLTRGETGDFRCACPRGIGRIQAVNVKADINGFASHLLPHLPHQRNQGLHPAVLGRDHPEPLRMWEGKSRTSRLLPGAMPGVSHVPTPR